MKFLTQFVALMSCLTTLTHGANASWAKYTDTELIKRSEIIVVGELIGLAEVKLRPDQAKLTLGVLNVEEVLKGDKNQTMILLKLPSREGLRLSNEIFYKKGQKGLWFLHLSTQGEIGIYLADHPQRFLSSKQVAQIEAFRKLLKIRAGKP